MTLSAPWVFDTSGFPARWNCGDWSPWLGWTHIASDLLIWLAYLAIPLVIVYFVRRRREVPFPALFWLFGAFIVTCGTTHLLDAVIFYEPVYRLAGVVKLATAVASWAAVIALVPAVPVALAMRTAREMEREVAARTAEGGAANAALRLEVKERRRAEAAMAASEERFRSAFEDTNVAMVLTDDGFRFERVNAAFDRLFGYGRGEMPGLSMAEVIHPDDIAEGLARKDELRSGKIDSFQVENRYLGKGGRVFWGLTSVSAVRVAPGRVAQYVAQVQDVTERKRAEEELRRERQMLRLVLDNIPQGVFWKASDLRYLGCNQVVARAMGFVSPGLIAGLSDADLPSLSPEQAAFFARKDREVMDADAAQSHIHERMTLADGRTVWLDTTKVPLHDAEGRVAGILGTWEDVTERHLAEQALRESEERFRTLIDTLPDAVFINAGSRVAFCNPACLRLLGATDQAQVIGMAVLDLHPPKYHEAIRARIAAVRADAPPVGRLEEEVIRLDGRPVPVDVTPVPITDRGGEAILVVLHDLTGRKRLEEQYRQSQKMEVVGQLAGGVAHDFNNLLCVINGYGEMLLARLPQGDPAREMIQEMTRAGERAAGLTRQLLAFSRKAVMIPEILDLDAVVLEMEKMLRRTIGEDVDLVVRLQPGLGRVKADPGQVEQVLMNLCVNARDAMPRGGKLTVETRDVELDETYAGAHPEVTPGRHVLLAVSDTGEGMTEEVKARIFEPFYTTKEKGRGTGLGLSTVFGIVKQSGGSIEVSSEPGRGASFEVYLPRVEKEAAPRKSSPDLSAVPRGAETILLVEDDESVRALTRIVLTGSGYTILEAGTGEEGLRVAEGYRGPIHLLISDVVMPELGGPEMAGRLAALRPEAKVLFLSGYTDDAIVRHGILQEKVNFLQKPFSTTALARKVRDVLDQP